MAYLNRDTEPANRISPLSGGGSATALVAGEWLSFAAAPTFASMALLTGISGEDMPDMLCSAGHGGSPLSGMAVMYLLMSAFHLAPWLRLISGRRYR
ncbi:hypothetical protein ATN84_16375 [Paramesorhizobium deserti]|uniref:Uncharacterized protein n=1 Tax=Paramesorhizobium deserti TaxID=1494590 RepID=A0A135HQU4_9HYPH|nr:hypothetical protein [Paramesorhizobium deserti]KXF75578.1 hypothetical protein ATN84_16375 [Paramesorhizobium deserti]